MATHKRYRLLDSFVYVALVTLLCSTSAAAPAEDRLAILDLTLNEVDRGDTLVVLRGKDTLVHLDALTAAGFADVHGHVETISGKRFVSLTSIKPALKFTVDEDKQTLRVTAGAKMFPLAVIDLGNSKPKELEYRTDPSAFLNYSWKLKDFAEATGFVEGGMSVGGALVSSTAFGSMQTGVVRGLSSIVYDYRKHLTRITLGDTFASSGELGGAQFIGGLSIAKNFGIDPYYIRQPAMGYTGAALTPSMLDVWVNGTRIRSVPIAPGPFQVQNLPVNVGTGNIRYVLRDAFGQEHSVDTRYSMIGSQLKQGTAEYNYAVGFRRFDMGTDSFDYRQLVGFGMHRIGITDRFTLGMRLEGAANMVSGGTTTQLILPFGHASFSVAASTSPEGMGIAAAARVGYWSRKFVAMAMAQGTSPHYAHGGLEATADRNLLETRLSASIAPTNRFSLSTDTTFVIPRDFPKQFRYGGSLNVRLAKQFQLLIGAHGVVAEDEHTWTEASANLTYAFDNGVVVSTGARTTATSAEGYATVSKPMMKVIDSGFRASGTMGPQPRGDIAVESQGSQGRFMATLTGDADGTHTTIQGSGAVVAVKGAGPFLTRPVQNGFAVLQVPGVRGVRGYLENQEIGRTDENGNLVIPNVLSYYGSRLGIAPADVPFDYDFDTTEQIISPPLRGGALVHFYAKPTRRYRGFSRIDDHGRQVIPSYGELEVSKGNVKGSSPIGKLGEFELADLSTGQYQAKITYADGTCAFHFNVESGTTIVIDLGTIVCVLKNEEEEK